MLSANKMSLVKTEDLERLKTKLTDNNDLLELLESYIDFINSNDLEEEFSKFMEEE